MVCPLGSGLVVEDKPTEFSCMSECSSLHPYLTKAELLCGHAKTESFVFSIVLLFLKICSIISSESIIKKGNQKTIKWNFFLYCTHSSCLFQDVSYLDLRYYAS